VATAAVLLLLSEKPRYPKLGAYPKYGDFTLSVIAVLNERIAMHVRLR
jgi:hypothetical protein